jgi:peptidoglycan hydrolase-like protein with peptidoglycan-binding domain
MKAQATGLFALYALSMIASAEENVRSVQEELRRRRVYFGDVDGRRTPELEAAMKRYQAHKGFTPSGLDDRDTMRSLGLAPRDPNEPPPKELSWPEEPVLRSDTTIDVGAAAAQIAQETGVSAASIAPASGPRTSIKFRKAVAPRGRVGRGGDAAMGSSRPAGRKLIGSDQQLDPKELREFVNDYLKAVEKNDLRTELGFYGDRVDYFQNGQVDRRIIERTLRDYYRRWPNRSYSLGPSFGYSRNPKLGQIIVSFHVNFSLKGNGKRVKGTTENRFFINAATADPRIVKIEEHRIRG